jgi:hypothetical protein
MNKRLIALLTAAFAVSPTLLAAQTRHAGQGREEG